MNEKRAVQTWLSEHELDTLRRVVEHYQLQRAAGAPSPTGVDNIKAALEACVRITGWLLGTGITPPAHVVQNGDSHDSR